MAQYVPSVSESDIERIVRRDYPSDLHAFIYEVIRGIEVREKPRVIMACLKNANGNFEKLKGELTNAGGWWREIISEAEYPNYTKKMFRIDRLSADEKERIIEKDKSQYLTWLHGSGPSEKNEAQQRDGQRHRPLAAARSAWCASSRTLDRKARWSR